MSCTMLRRVCSSLSLRSYMITSITSFAKICSLPSLSWAREARHRAENLGKKSPWSKFNNESHTVWCGESRSQLHRTIILVLRATPLRGWTTSATSPMSIMPQLWRTCLKNRQYAKISESHVFQFLSKHSCFQPVQSEMRLTKSDWVPA